MQSDYVIRGLESSMAIYSGLLKDLSPGEIIYRPAPGKWNLLEIICHLYDEEREDFRARLDHVLRTPDQPLPSIDPQGLVLSRDYASQNFDDKLSAFLSERKESLAWLRSLNDPPLDNAFIHPKFGRLTGWMFLTNWLAHDYLHIRQITRTRYEFLKHHSGDPLLYAGEW